MSSNKRQNLQLTATLIAFTMLTIPLATSDVLAKEDLIFLSYGDAGYYFFPVAQGRLGENRHIGNFDGTDTNWEPETAADIDGDGTEDLIFRHSESGQIRYWKMQNGQKVGESLIGKPVGLDWVWLDAGDVDGDGWQDLVFQHENGQVHYWKMQNGHRLGGFNIDSPVDANWSFSGVGDVDGDATADIVWQHESGLIHYWKMSGGQRVGGFDIGNAPGEDMGVEGVGDLDGDGTEDILISDNLSDDFHFWKMEQGHQKGLFQIAAHGDGIYVELGNVDGR